MKETLQLFKALADKSRLRIVAALKEGPMYVELLAQRLELSPSTISFHLKKLEESGLVTSSKEQYYVQFTLNSKLLEEKVIDLISYDSDEVTQQKERELKYREEIIKSYFIDGKVVSMPVQKEKRKIILEEIIKAFKIEEAYSEKEVNLIIANFTDDFCNIRNELVEQKLLFKAYDTYLLTSSLTSTIKLSIVPELIKELLYEDEKILLLKLDNFNVNIKVFKNINFTEEYLLYVTNRGRILVQKVSYIKTLGKVNYVFAYDFIEKHEKNNNGLIEKVFSYEIRDNKQLSCKKIDNHVLCIGKNLRIRGNSAIGGLGTEMDLEMTLSVEEFNYLKNKLKVNLFAEETE